MLYLTKPTATTMSYIEGEEDTVVGLPTKSSASYVNAAAEYRQRGQSKRTNRVLGTYSTHQLNGALALGG